MIHSSGKGSAQIAEAVIVLPLVMAAVLTAVFISLYSYQCFALKTVTDRMAGLYARALRTPGILCCYEDGDLSSDFDFNRSPAYLPSAQTVSDIASAVRPYRYLSSDGDLKKEIEKMTEKLGRDVLFFSDFRECKAEMSGGIRGQTVRVSISVSGELPLLPGKIMNYTAESVCPVADRCETVRNTDLCLDFGSRITGDSDGILKKIIGEIGKNIGKTGAAPDE